MNWRCLNFVFFLTHRKKMAQHFCLIFHGLVSSEMPAVMLLRRKTQDDRPLAGARIVGCTHMTAQAAVCLALWLHHVVLFKCLFVCLCTCVLFMLSTKLHLSTPPLSFLFLSVLWKDLSFAKVPQDCESHLSQKVREASIKSKEKFHKKHVPSVSCLLVIHFYFGWVQFLVMWKFAVSVRRKCP